ncbi:MAG: hypothetical protein Q9161_004406 [Pseudevernia consocians]
MASNKTSYATTSVVIMVSQVGPTFVMPVFHLEISGRFTWLVRSIMWLSAPVTVLPAYALRRLKKWRKRGQQPHMDGLLPLNELIEFIYLHEKGQGYGGTLNDDLGKTIRDLLEGQISGEASSIHVETEGSRFRQSTESVSSRSVQSLHLEGSTAVEVESTSGPTSIQSHRQEGSTATEDVPAPGLRRRGDRSTECYDPVVSMGSMQIPERTPRKNAIHGLPTPINDKYVEQGAPNGLLLRRDLPLKNLSSSVRHCRHRLPIVELYRNRRKDSGLVTDSFLFEHE